VKRIPSFGIAMARWQVLGLSLHEYP
jgi:hypothetical protein